MKFDFHLSTQSSLYQWDGSRWGQLNDAEPLFLEAQRPVAVIPSDQRTTELILAYQWQVPDDYLANVEVSQSVLSAKDDNLFALFTLGDVNEDDLVNSEDVGLLALWLKSHSSEVTCLGAADVTMDGNVTNDDLVLLTTQVDRGISIPALTFSPNLPCSHSKLRFAASPNAAAGSDVIIQVITDEVIEMTSLEDDVEIWSAASPEKFFVANEATDGTVTVSLKAGDKHYYYTFSTFAHSEEEPDLAFEFGEWNEEGFPGEHYKADLISNDCPLRGAGCVGLILDFVVKNEKLKNDASKYRTLDSAKKAGCAITYHVPQFKKFPGITVTDQRRALQGKFVVSLPLNKSQIAVNAHNSQQWRKIYEVIDKYRESARGKETAAEVIFAHGSGSTMGWVPGFRVGQNYKVRSLNRLDMHSLIHQSINKKVCSHFVLDTACFSGHTPLYLQQLNNSGKALKALYKDDLANVNHYHHAAWELNMALGIADIYNTCDGTKINKAKSKLEALFLQNGNNFNKTFREFSKADHTNSRYIDEGFRMEGGNFVCDDHDQKGMTN